MRVPSSRSSSGSSHVGVPHRRALGPAATRRLALRELIGVVADVLRLVRGLAADRSAPLRVRVAVVALVAWLVSPIDLVPEFIPVLGLVDDVVVAVLVLRYVRRSLGEAEFRRRWPGSAEGLALLEPLLS